MLISEQTGNKGNTAAKNEVLSAPTTSFAEGGSITPLREKFASNPLTVTGSMTIPLDTGTVHSGFAPRLSLMKFLLIGDNQQLLSDVTFFLQIRYQHIEVICVDKCLDALNWLKTALPNLIILDSAVSGKDYSAWISKIREFSDTPVLVLSQGETDVDRARGLEAGADEYITKPFTAVELLARCNALLRRTRKYSSDDDFASFDKLTINFSTREVFLSDEPLKLTPIEYGLLSALARNGGHVVAQDDLLERVWGQEYSGDFYLVKTYVYRLRSKLESASQGKQFIQNVRGFGYRLNANGSRTQRLDSPTL